MKDLGERRACGKASSERELTSEKLLLSVTSCNCQLDTIQNLVEKRVTMKDGLRQVGLRAFSMDGHCDYVK